MARRSLGLFDATMIVAGSMIGSGVFIVSADIAQTVGSAWMLILVWGLTGVLTLVAALSYGELAGLMPKAGGQYVYLREAYGRMAGFLYGWTLFTVIQTGTIAAVAMAFAKHLAVLLPPDTITTPLVEVGEWSIRPTQFVAIATILFLTAINTRGIRLGRIIQNTFTTTKIVSVVLLAVLCLVVGWGSGVWSANLAGTSVVEPRPDLLGIPLLGLLSIAMVGSLFSSDAWNNVTFVAAEIDDPRRTIPRALGLGVLIVTVLYLGLNLGYLGVLSMDQIAMAPDGRVAAYAASMLEPTSGAAIMAILIMVSTFGCNNGLIMSGARAYYAMAKDGLFFRGASTLNDAGVPARSLWIQASWASLLCLSGQYGNLLDYVVFAVLIFYALTIGGIIRLRITQPTAERPVRAVGYPLLPALYIVAAIGICICLLVYKPMYTWPGLAIVALGMPVYLLWTRRGSATTGDTA